MIRKKVINKIARTIFVYFVKEIAILIKINFHKFNFDFNQISPYPEDKPI